MQTQNATENQGETQGKTFKVIRQSFPRVREVEINGQMLYAIDARKRGWHGSRIHHRASKADAIALAQSIAESFITQPKTTIDDLENAWHYFPKEYIPANVLYRLEKMAKDLTHILKQKGINLDITEAVSEPIHALLDKYLEYKTNNPNKPLSANSLKGIRYGVKMFKDNLPNNAVASFDFKFCDAFIAGLKGSQVHKKNMKTQLGMFFNWCIKHDYCKNNPCANIEIRVDETEIQIYDNDQVKRIFETAMKPCHLPLLPYVAILLFSGLRPSEAQRLTWGNVNLETQEIEVSRDGKTGSRYVPIYPPLFAWLEYVQKQNANAPIICQGFKIRFENMKKDLGFWGSDYARHTFCTMHYNQRKDKKLTAHVAGNSEDTLNKHYLKAIPANQVETFWGILPDTIKA